MVRTAEAQVLTLERQQAVETALASVLASEEFAGADRLKDFLAHVIAMDLAGRSSELRAKTIAIDVYQRSAGEADAENLVRVDAGRLRRRLDLYYGGTGTQDPLRIHIDRGGYTPRYSDGAEPAIAPVPNMPAPEQPAQPAQPPRGVSSPIARWSLGIATLSLALSGTMLWLAYSKASETTPPPQMAGPQPPISEEVRLRREILFHEAPERLQAFNLVEQGLGMLLPAPDPIRTEAGLILFDRAALLDPTYAGAPAASALAYGIRTGLTPPGDVRDSLFGMLEQHKTDAMRLDATDPLSLTASAMYDFIAQDYVSAQNRLSRALEIDPANHHVRDYYAVIAFFSGDAQTVVDLTDPDKQPTAVRPRGATQNARAGAMLMLGKPDEAIRIMTDGAAAGDPISVINHAILAASYQADGRTREAKLTKARIERAWPGADPGKSLRLLFIDPSDAAVIIGYLEEIG